MNMIDLSSSVRNTHTRIACYSKFFLFLFALYTSPLSIQALQPRPPECYRYTNLLSASLLNWGSRARDLIHWQGLVWARGTYWNKLAVILSSTVTTWLQGLIFGFSQREVRDQSELKDRVITQLCLNINMYRWRLPACINKWLTALMKQRAVCKWPLSAKSWSKETEHGS
jgi:hypothetical protein